MADELTISLSGSFSKSGLRADTKGMGLIGLQFDVSGADYFHGTQNIDTSPEALIKGDITTPGYIFVKNLSTHASAYVEIHGATFSSTGGTIKLFAGEAAAFRSASAAPYAIATVAACDIEYLMIEA